MNRGFNVIFMGTPDFAVPTLRRLGDSHHHVLLAVTQPDRPRGRGRRLTPSPVKLTAVDMGIEVYQPDNLRVPAVSDRLKACKADVFIVVAFGNILSAGLLSIPPCGAINIHASLLPKYRGPSPIPWAILNGENETGVTTIQMDSGMDTGDILMYRKTAVSSNDTASSLHDRLADLGAGLLMDTLESMGIGQIKPLPQDEALSSYAPMFKKGDGRIDWSLPAENLERFIRAMTPWPGAFTFHNQKRLKIFSATVISKGMNAPSGVVLEAASDKLLISTGNCPLSIREIQGESGKRLAIKDFLLGYTIRPGDIFN